MIEYNRDGPRKHKWFYILSALKVDEHEEFSYETEADARKIGENLYKAKARYIRIHEPSAVFKITRLYTSKVITIRRDK